MNIIDKMIATTDHKRYRSVPKSFEDNIKMPISTTKKLDIVKSIEFEPREKDESTLNLTDNFDRG